MQLILAGKTLFGITAKYERYLNHRIRTVGDLRFDLNNIDCFEFRVKHIEKTNVLEWIGLSHSVPIDLRNAYYIPDCTDLSLSFKTDGGLFDVTKINLRIITPFMSAKKLKCEFSLSDQALKKLFFSIQSLLSHTSRPFSSM